MEWEYVNISNLLVPEDNSGQILTIDQEGKNSFVPKSSKKIISIEAWTDAFLVFIDIYCKVNSDQYPELLKYLHTIRMGAKQYVDGWLVYDEQFRIKKANYPSMSWAIVDQELWLLFMCRPRLRVDSFPGRSFKCYDFNYKGECKKSL